MSLARLHPRHFWTAEKGMTGLLIFTVVYLFVICATSETDFGDLVADLAFSFIVVSGVLATFRQRWVRSGAIILALATLAVTWLQEIHPTAGLALLNAALRLSFLAFLFAVLIVQVFGPGPVTRQRVHGAIVVYLLLGGMWSLVYYIVALTIPDAFRLAEGLATGDLTAFQRLLTYFSFVTLTTTGFGDITPVHPLARTLAMFEALAGQLYLVITLARLVSLTLGTRKDNIHSP